MLWKNHFTIIAEYVGKGEGRQGDMGYSLKKNLERQTHDKILSANGRLLKGKQAKGTDGKGQFPLGVLLCQTVEVLYGLGGSEEKNWKHSENSGVRTSGSPP